MGWFNQKKYICYWYSREWGETEAKEKKRWVKQEGEGGDRGENPTKKQERERRKNQMLKSTERVYL